MREEKEVGWRRFCFRFWKDTFHVYERDRKRYSKRETHTQRKTDRQTDRQTERQKKKERQTDIQRHTETDSYAVRQTENA